MIRSAPCCSCSPARPDDEIFILEANPRASRTAPFVAKAINRPIAAAAAKVMAGVKLKELKLDRPSKKHVAVKEAVFPFARFPGVDPLLGPEMRSTGEVMGWDRSFALAFLKAQMGAGTQLPESGRVFLSIKDSDKTEAMADAARGLIGLGFEIVATRGTAQWLEAQGARATAVNKVYEGRPNIVDSLKNGDIALVMKL